MRCRELGQLRHLNGEQWRGQDDGPFGLHLLHRRESNNKFFGAVPLHRVEIDLEGPSSAFDRKPLVHGARRIPERRNERPWGQSFLQQLEPLVLSSPVWNDSPMMFPSG